MEPPPDEMFHNQWISVLNVKQKQELQCLTLLTRREEELDLSKHSCSVCEGSSAKVARLPQFLPMKCKYHHFSDDKHFMFAKSCDLCEHASTLI